MKLTFVAVTDTDENWRALRAALVVARRFHGHVDAVYMHPNVDLDITDALRRVDQHLRDELLARFKQEVEAQVDQARKRFTALAAEHEVAVRSEPSGDAAATASWQVAEGRLSDVVRSRAIVYDTAIFAQSVQGKLADWQLGVEAALFAAGRPVLLVPPKEYPSIGETVLIGWNRTAPAARALFSALPFLRQARRVIVWSVNTGAKQGPAPHEAARLLAAHGVAASVEEVAPGKGSVAEQLLTTAETLGADLVVMGAYSHSRFREVILGGVTRHVLRHAACPVLLAH